MTFISNAMGWVLARLSGLFGHNFAASVFAFTVLVNLLMLPLTLKTQKSTAKQAKLKPKLDALKKKYGNDRQKYSQAMNDLYAKEQVSMSGGCLPMFIRLFIMIGVYWAVASPFTYVSQIEPSAVNAAKEWTAYVRTAESSAVAASDWEALGLETVMQEEGVVSAAEQNGQTPEYYAKLAILNRAAVMDSNSVTKGSPEERVRTAISSNRVLREVEIAGYILKDRTETYRPVVESVFVANGGEISEIGKINFNLFGIDLTQMPDFSWNFSNWQAIWIIPILSFVTSMLTSVISMVIQKKANPDAPSMAAMMLIMPLFSLYIAFKVPGAVGFYWACSNIVAGGVQAATQLLYGPSEVIAREQGKTVSVIAAKERAIILRASADADDAANNKG